jgi:MGT family glycosyltransferase
MAHIVVAPLLESGHVHPTLRLAKRLRERGHLVTYVGHRRVVAPEYPFAPWQDLFAKNGFAFVPIYTTPPSRRRTRGPALGLATMRQLARDTNAMLDFLARGGADEALSSLGADLILVDRDAPYLALIARALGLPTALFSCNLLFQEEDWLPLPWRREVLRRLRRHVLPRVGLMPRAYASVAALMARAAHPRSDLDDRHPQLPRLRGEHLPTIVFCPAAFDATPRPPGLVFSSPPVDLERFEPPFEWQGLRAHRRLLYCTAGSLGPAQIVGLQVIRRAIAVVGRSDDLQMVVSWALDPGLLGELPPNVLVQARVPQLSVLRRADVILCHAALGSILEAILLGVPILAFPGGFDQPLNATRIARHGIGLVGDQHGTSADELERMIRAVLADGKMRDRVRALGDQIRADPQREVEFVEGLLSAR